MLAENLLKIFGQDCSSMERNRVTRFDWSAHGIDCVYVIFITGRCGSTWLTHLIEDSGMCGNPHELFNETMMPRFNRSIDAQNFPQYFSGLVSNYSSQGRFGFKIDEFRFRQLLPLIEFGSVFQKESTKFFWMTRRDIVDQAFSYARAKATGHWHDFATSGAQSDGDGDVDIADARLWNEIIEIVAKESRMERFFQDQGIDPVQLDYEQMTADRLLTVTNVLIELGCDHEQVHAFIGSMEDKTLKLQTGNKYRLLGEFCAKYRPLLRRVSRERSGTDLAELKRELLLDYQLQV